jgi:hypothetical protein
MLGGPELVRLFEVTENCEEGDESSGLRKTGNFMFTGIIADLV